jgi:4,5-dihydroxyphthalate decarboxylase
MRLSLACGDYDRTRPLIDGTVAPLGIELTCLPMPVEEARHARPLCARARAHP